MREAVVLALDTPGGKQLAGYLVSDLASQDGEQQATLREALKKTTSRPSCRTTWCPRT
nr:hypothetical protein GCM10020185_07210 [Pseudomonas brassicacearum subsp. brassicacearum]